jgi:hypothetical protein
MKVKECRYCDGTTSGFPYGKDESRHCLTCGAEWDPVEVDYSEEEEEADED